MSRDLARSFRPGSVWRSTSLHLALLVLALMGAWLSFRQPMTNGRSEAAEGVVVLQADEGDVERLVYEGTGETLEIEAREDGVGRWFAGREGEDAVFVGGNRVEQVWRTLEPLRAVRVLDGVRGEKLEELELIGEGSTGETLSLTVRGRAVRYRLGGRPFGGSDRYAMREGGTDGDRDPPGRVLVLPSEVVDLGGGAALLMERRLLRATRPMVEAMTLSRPGAGGGPLRVLQVIGAGVPGPTGTDTYWTVDGSDEADADLGAWADKFFRLSVAAYRGDEPGPDWRPEVTITIESREVGDSTLEIWSLPAEESRVWLARSPFTRLAVELSASLAEEVCADLDGLL
ncbi:MAG: hypothetical protein OXG81_08295 [Acidobacteria bacterium]|nr:hypothetical protein [Acidobacteriota bacterium]